MLTARQANGCSWGPEQPNKRILGYNLRTVRANTKEDCKRLCLNEPFCRSVEYVAGSKNCNLNAKDTSTERLDTNGDYTYFELLCQGSFTSIRLGNNSIQYQAK